MSSFANIALVALLSNTAFALAPRQAGILFANTTSTTATGVPLFNATSTVSSALSTGTLTPLRPTAPGSIGNWNLLGCANSPSGFLGWVQVASTPIMSEEYCTVSCTDYLYAGTNGANCYCGTEFQDLSVSTFPDSCDVPCPGNPLQACGGVVPTNETVSALANSKRQLNLQALLLTTYVNAAYDPQPPININIGDIIVNIDIVVYVDVCDTCAGGLTTCTTTSTCSTTATCGCSTEQIPTIPLTTVTRPCSACGTDGAPSTITVTIPVDAITTSTATLPGGAIITGAPAGSAVGGDAAVTGTDNAVTGTETAVIGGGITVTPFVTSTLFTGQARREMGGVLGAVAAGFLALLL